MAIPNPCPQFADDSLDGFATIDLPPERFLTAFFDVDILDWSGKPLLHNVDADEPLKVRFRVVLTGKIWSCVAGDWAFELGFTAIGESLDFKLSDKLGRDKFRLNGWRGCDTATPRHAHCIEKVVDVPPNTVPADKLYECGGWVELRCCADGPVVVAGSEALEERFFFQ